MKLWQRRILEIVALGGGSVGVTIALQQMLAWTGVLNFLLLLTAVAIYSWGIWAGLVLIEGRPGAEKMNRRYWLVQAPIFSSPLLAGFIWGGANFSIKLGIWPMALNWHAGLGGSFQFNVLNQQAPFEIGVNLFALAVVVWLARVAAPVSATPEIEKSGEVAGS